MRLLTVFFAITTVICVRGWFCSKVAEMTAARYIADNIDKLPTVEELVACRNQAIKELLHLR